MSGAPDNISRLLQSLQSCISDINAEATANMHEVNDKAELTLVTTKRSKHLIIYLIQPPLVMFKLLSNSLQNIDLTLDCHLDTNEDVSSMLLGGALSGICWQIRDKYSNCHTCSYLCYVKN